MTADNYSNLQQAEEIRCLNTTIVYYRTHDAAGRNHGTLDLAFLQEGHSIAGLT
jgi:hypothetical protein